ncbi:O-antigen ligase family protein [Pantoea stewartii]|uniref:O-antigen ligase family protein n=1 Tax=Pantoea stewartii TaxID=66269 RepID=UPI0023F7D612|nr:O-antigen ligase family protein [Pantoea stewartii]MDF7786996.1 O-antigen ligase family protein [Pantoea stewartii]MEB6537170.1 O-antigen ligase family protein [Pantoea stewartii]
MKADHLIIKKDALSRTINILIFIGCIFSFMTSPFGGSLGRNAFYLTSYLSFLVVVFNLKNYLVNKRNLILPGAFFAVGIISIIWTVMYKQPGDFISLYRQYQSTGRLQIAAAFILLVTLNEKTALQKNTVIAAILCGLVVNGYAIYQGIYLHIQRVELNFDRATVAAYIITAVNLVFTKAVLLLKSRHRILLFLAAFTFSYAAIVLTGTRAAMLAYPVLTLIIVLMSTHIISRRHKIILFTLVPVMIALSAAIFHNVIALRIQQFNEDIAHMHEQTGENSIISRLSMQTVAFRTGSEAIWGESAEQRAEEAKAIVAKEPALYGALTYLTVHMHNEVMETFSIKGILGVLALIGLYFCLLCNALLPYRNPALLAVTISLITYGLSDVIFFSTEGTLIYCLAVIMSILLIKTSDGLQETE